MDANTKDNDRVIPLYNWSKKKLRLYKKKNCIQVTRWWCTWFWFKLISMAWHDATLSGRTVILFLDRFNASSCLSRLKSTGKWVIWLPERLTVLRLVKSLILEGIQDIWLFSPERVSSFCKPPISDGRFSEIKKRKATIIFYKITTKQFG